MSRGLADGFPHGLARPPAPRQASGPPTFQGDLYTGSGQLPMLLMSVSLSGLIDGGRPQAVATAGRRREATANAASPSPMPRSSADRARSSAASTVMPEALLTNELSPAHSCGRDPVPAAPLAPDVPAEPLAAAAPFAALLVPAPLELPLAVPLAVPLAAPVVPSGVLPGRPIEALTAGAAETPLPLVIEFPVDCSPVPVDAATVPVPAVVPDVPVEPVPTVVPVVPVPTVEPVPAVVPVEPVPAVVPLPAVVPVPKPPSANWMPMPGVTSRTPGAVLAADGVSERAPELPPWLEPVPVPVPLGLSSAVTPVAGAEPAPGRPRVATADAGTGAVAVATVPLCVLPEDDPSESVTGTFGAPGSSEVVPGVPGSSEDVPSAPGSSEDVPPAAVAGAPRISAGEAVTDGLGVLPDPVDTVAGASTTAAGLAEPPRAPVVMVGAARVADGDVLAVSGARPVLGVPTAGTASPGTASSGAATATAGVVAEDVVAAGVDSSGSTTFGTDTAGTVADGTATACCEAEESLSSRTGRARLGRDAADPEEVPAVVAGVAVDEFVDVLSTGVATTGAATAGAPAAGAATAGAEAVGADAGAEAACAAGVMTGADGAGLPPRAAVTGAKSDVLESSAVDPEEDWTVAGTVTFATGVVVMVELSAKAAASPRPMRPPATTAPSKTRRARVFMRNLLTGQWVR